jgi:exodeoxyribonuclease III
VRIATFNINNVRKRLDNLLEWLGETRPDIVCLQELKATDAQFPVDAISRAGYEAVWRGQPVWNGVAILARGRRPILVRDALPGDPEDRQSRYIETAVGGVLIASIYAPNGSPAPGPKFKYKLAWLDRLARHAHELNVAGVPAILAGDYNIAPGEADIYATRSYDGSGLIQPEARARYRMLLDQGWIDAVRQLQPKGSAYTFWDYRRKRWDRDAGLRLDHLLLAGPVVHDLQSFAIHRDVRGRTGASDHAPVSIEIREP